VGSGALERLLAALRTAPKEEAAVLREKVLSLYQGDFFGGATISGPALILREKHRNSVLSIVLSEGTACERNGKWASAADHYARGIAIDGLAEEFYLRLMVCQRELGNHSGAVRTYLQCSKLLRSELGIAPSPEPTALYRALLQHV
jgi:two-component SAPR family response regulator